MGGVQLGGARRPCDPRGMDQVERTLLRTLLSASAESCGTACWRPAVDVYRLQDGWLCKFDLAGVRLEDVEVHASCNRLRVSGVRCDRSLADGSDPWSLEISYHVFERTVDLPCELERCRIECATEDGMLLVRVAAEDGR